MIERLQYISQEPGNGTHLSAIKEALDAGCTWIQLRVKEQPQAIIASYAAAASELCQQYSAKLIVNDHPEIALQCGAYGLHLGLEDMPVAEARALVGSGMIIGGTANTFEHIRQRAAEGVDYIGLGPYRFTSTKKKLSPVLGPDGYREIMMQVRAAGIATPIIAIGGIVAEDIAPLIQTGLYGVAVSAAITGSENKAQTVQNMYQQLAMAAPEELQKEQSC